MKELTAGEIYEEIADLERKRESLGTDRSKLCQYRNKDAFSIGILDQEINRLLNEMEELKKTKYLKKED